MYCIKKAIIIYPSAGGFALISYFRCITHVTRDSRSTGHETCFVLSLDLHASLKPVGGKFVILKRDVPRSSPRYKKEYWGLGLSNNLSRILHDVPIPVVTRCPTHIAQVNIPTTKRAIATVGFICIELGPHVGGETGATNGYEAEI